MSRWVIGPETVEGERFETPWTTLSIPGSGLDGVLVFQPQQVSQILWIDGRTSPGRDDVPDHVGLVSLRVGMEECLAVSGGIPLHAFATSGSPALVLPPLAIGVRAELTFRSWRAEPCRFEIRLRGRVARSA